MASKSKKSKKDKNPDVVLGMHLKQETRHTILSVVFFVFTIFFALAAFGYAGTAGDSVYKILNKLFGVGYVLFPVVLALLGISFFKLKRPNVGRSHSISAVLFLLSSLGIVHIVALARTGDATLAGWLGYALGWPMNEFFDMWAGGLFLFAFVVISLFVMFDRRPSLKAFFARFKRKESEEDEEEEWEEYEEGEEEEYEDEEYEEEEGEEYEDEEYEEEEEENKKSLAGMLGMKGSKEAEAATTGGTPYFPSMEYKIPPLKLLQKDSGKASVGDTKANSNIIKRTLKNFNINVEMDEVTVGPAVTRYAMKPAQGVRLSRITALQNELALALAASTVRIEAPIPGRSLVGIETPNSKRSTVGLGSALRATDFKDSSKPLTVSLGKDISGKAWFANLAKMPHLMIAGTTGSGKSVTAHTIITSLLYRNGPQDLRFIMVDPKRVELTLYNKIPHQLTPVITDPKKAVLAIQWAVKEMERRYEVLQENTCKDISSFHTHRKTLTESLGEDHEEVRKLEGMPYIVIIIDEMADLMQTYPRELEAGIVRLAQMSRAVGIHLVLSTQRPDSNVITGLIKANIPTRIALRVSSQVNSRIIIDEPGAEKLLGNGDMLYAADGKPPVRIQCSFISEKEIKAVVKYIDDHSEELPDEVQLTEKTLTGDISIKNALSNEGDDDDLDSLFEEAKETVIRDGRASTSFLQRKLRIGYSRAARIIDELEDRGVIGPANGSKPREVYADNESELPEDEYEEETLVDDSEDEAGYEEEEDEEEYEDEEEVEGEE